MVSTSEKTSLKYKLKDIYLDVTWSKIANRYFGKSCSWLYNKFNGVDGNGKTGEFTYGERLQLRNALLDFSDRIRIAANSLDI
jgi:hypothetical protein